MEMRRLAAFLFGLLLVVAHADAPRAQSGRNRSVPTADKGGAATKPPAGDSRVEAGTPDASGAQPEVVEGDVVRVETSLVTIPVSVRDRSGRYAPDLRREDFRVFE